MRVLFPAMSEFAIKLVEQGDGNRLSRADALPRNGLMLL
jgi:hypothetical protein